MLYQIMNGTVSCGGQEILSHVDFEIKGKEKIAIVGANGAGKTTLLKLIAGELTLDRDDKRNGPGIFECRNLTVGMLSQTPKVDMRLTAEELFYGISAEEQDIENGTIAFWEFERLFTGFGFSKEDKKKTLESFSGGEQTKIFMIKLLLEKPDILLLDEPTNHLDMETVEWLEGYMREYDKAVVFVSHDRFFLDQVVDVVYELSGKRLKRYVGTYTEYRKQKAKDQIIQKKAYERDMAEVERLNQLIEKFKNKPKKASFARSRETLLRRMKLTEKPEEEEIYHFSTPIEPEVPGSKWVVEAEHLKIGYDRVLLELSLRVRKGQKIAVIGENGVGKSTFLKTVAGLLEKKEGKLTLGNNTVLGYFDQHTAAIESEKTVYDHFHDLFPGMLEKDTRNLLASFLFKGRDAQKKVSDLSGGEKSRLLLAEMLTGRPNLLLLDEPTNHMDIRAKENLESAFSVYTGTILFVSHDRYFVKELADALLVFSNDSVMYYPFGYEHYMKRKNRSETGDIAAMVDAEDQALIAGLRAVPKAEHHEARQMTTEEAHLDWKLSLAAKPMREAEEIFAEAWEAYQTDLEARELEDWKHFAEYIGNGNSGNNTDQEGVDCAGIHFQDEISPEKYHLEELRQTWTEKCLEWYENLLPEEDEEDI